MTTLTAETIQDAMHREGLKTYEELQHDVSSLQLDLKVAVASRKVAYNIADKYEWRAKVWRTIALGVVLAVAAWRLWLIFF